GPAGAVQQGAGPDAEPLVDPRGRTGGAGEGRGLVVEVTHMDRAGLRSGAIVGHLDLELAEPIGARRVRSTAGGRLLDIEVRHAGRHAGRVGQRLTDSVGVVAGQVLRATRIGCEDRDVVGHRAYRRT